MSPFLKLEKIFFISIMKINNILIRSAGFGTRMGKLGKEIPKPIWPLFESSLLESQVKFYQDLSAEKIFCNTHHLFESIEEHIKEKKINIDNLFEKDLLLNGGAVYNLLKTKKIEGPLLVTAGDQFFKLKSSDVDASLENLAAGADIVLFLIKVKRRTGYNEVLVQGDDFIGISKEPNTDDYYTFSGACLIGPEKIKIKNGPQDFFPALCDTDVQKVKVVKIDEYEFFDFGTLDNYLKSILEIVKDSADSKYEFTRFLIDNNILDLDSLNLKRFSYRSSKRGEFKFSSGLKIQFVGQKAIVSYKELEDEVSLGFHSF